FQAVAIGDNDGVNVWDQAGNASVLWSGVAPRSLAYSPVLNLLATGAGAVWTMAPNPPDPDAVTFGNNAAFVKTSADGLVVETSVGENILTAFYRSRDGGRSYQKDANMKSLP